MSWVFHAVYKVHVKCKECDKIVEEGDSCCDGELYTDYEKVEVFEDKERQLAEDKARKLREEGFEVEIKPYEIPIKEARCAVPGCSEKKSGRALAGFICKTHWEEGYRWLEGIRAWKPMTQEPKISENSKKCSICGQLGHNARRCKNRGREHKMKEVVGAKRAPDTIECNAVKSYIKRRYSKARIRWKDNVWIVKRDDGDYDIEVCFRKIPQDNYEVRTIPYFDVMRDK